MNEETKYYIEELKSELKYALKQTRQQTRQNPGLPIKELAEIIKGVFSPDEITNLIIELDNRIK